MTFPQSHTHTNAPVHTLFWPLFCLLLNNLCILVFISLFRVFSIICILRILHTHTHTITSSEKGAIIFWGLLLQMEPSFHDRLVSFYACPLLHVFIYPVLTLFLSIFPAAISSSCMFMFIQTPLPLFPQLLYLPPPPASVLTCPAFVTCLVSITTATFQSVANHF